MKAAWVGWSSRSTLQPIAARSVCWRAGASRGPLRRRGSAPAASSCSSSSGVRSRSWAAASSIASGRLSSRDIIASIAGASSGRIVAPACSARALKSAAASSDNSGSTAIVYSPRRRSGARLVASTRSCGAAASRRLRSGAASSRCSKLSVSSRSRRVLRKTSSASPGSRSGARVRAKVPASAAGSSAGLFRRARSTNQAPSAYCACAACAASSASRVLPTPPGPVSVTRRASGRVSNSVSCARSATRPTKRSGGTGRLPVGSAGAWCTGGAAPSGGGRWSGALMPRAARTNASRCSGDTPSAFASTAAVSAEGRRASPSILAISTAEHAARSASSRCVRRSARRRCRTHAPNE